MMDEKWDKSRTTTHQAAVEQQPVGDRETLHSYMDMRNKKQLTGMIWVTAGVCYEKSGMMREKWKTTHCCKRPRILQTVGTLQT